MCVRIYVESNLHYESCCALESICLASPTWNQVPADDAATASCCFQIRLLLHLLEGVGRASCPRRCRPRLLTPRRQLATHLKAVTEAPVALPLGRALPPVLLLLTAAWGAAWGAAAARGAAWGTAAARGAVAGWSAASDILPTQVLLPCSVEVARPG